MPEPRGLFHRAVEEVLTFLVESAGGPGEIPRASRPERLSALLAGAIGAGRSPFDVFPVEGDVFELAVDIALGLIVEVGRARIPALATGERPLGQGFLDWRDWANQNPDMNVGRLMGRACPRLSEGEQLAYSAPFPDRRFKGGVRRFPNLVADRPDAPGAEIARQSAHWWHTEWSGPSFMVVGMKDPVLGPPVMRLMQRTIRGCPDPLPLAEAGHFVPEWSAEFAAPALAALDAAS